MKNKFSDGFLLPELLLFAIFSFWDMFDFVLDICSKLVWVLDEFRKEILWGELRLQAPDAYGLNPPNQLVIGIHWLALLNQVRKNKDILNP